MTREEAKEIFLNRGFIDGIHDGNKWRDACLVISEWLKEEPILDKVRAEIEQNAYPIVHGVNNHEKGMTLYGILQIIDKYKAESEE